MMYLNGEKNGRGIEYYRGELRYDIEYLYNCKRKGR